MTPPGDAAAAGRAQFLSFDRFSADVWNAVARGRRTPMHQHVWAKAAAEALSPDAPIRVLCAGDPDRPAALAAFSYSGAPLPRLRLLGAEELGEPAEVICREPGALDPLAEELARAGLAVGFGHYPADTPFIEALRRAFRGRGVVAERALPQRAAPRIALDESWRRPEEKLNARRRGDLRRMRRHAEALGDVIVDALAPGPADAPALLEEAFAVEAQSWKGRSGTAIARDEKLARFYRAYGRLAAAEGSLRLFFLRIGGVAAAMQIAVETESALWLLKIGYNEKYARCSPGNILMRDSIAYAAENGLSAFEFLGKESPWTELWTSEARLVRALRCYPASPAGLGALAADGASIGAKRLRERLSAGRERAHA